MVSASPSSTEATAPPSSTSFWRAVNPSPAISGPNAYPKPTPLRMNTGPATDAVPYVTVLPYDPSPNAAQTYFHIEAAAVSEGPEPGSRWSRDGEKEVFRNAGSHPPQRLRYWPAEDERETGERRQILRSSRCPSTCRTFSP